MIHSFPKSLNHRTPCPGNTQGTFCGRRGPTQRQLLQDTAGSFMYHLDALCHLTHLPLPVVTGCVPQDAGFETEEFIRGAPWDQPLWKGGRGAEVAEGIKLQCGFREGLSQHDAEILHTGAGSQVSIQTEWSVSFWFCPLKKVRLWFTLSSVASWPVKGT